MVRIIRLKAGLFYILMFLCLGKINAQEKCDCLANLDTTIRKTELNYAGFPDKVTERIRPEYQQLVKSLRKMAVSESDPIKCFSIIKRYVVFFNDKHFDFEYNVGDSGRYQYVNLKEADFIKSFKNSKRDAIEGVWMNPDSSVKIGVYKVNATTYKAVIIQSTDARLRPGLIYSTLTRDKEGFTFDKYNWLTPDFPARQHGGLLKFWNFEIWGKIYPDVMTDAEKAELSTWRNYNLGLNLKKIDDKNVLLTIGSFNRDNKIQEIIQKNDSLLRNTENLIVDLRGNGGGNAGWAYLLPYFYTQPIDQENAYLRLSPDNIQANLPGIRSVAENPPADPAWQKSFSPEYLAVYKRAVEEIPASKEKFYTLPSIKIYQDSVLTNPKRIALVFDDLGGSSTEFFLYLSRQSSKVIRYGTHTLGMMDYLGMSQPTKLPTKEYHLLIPDRKSSWTDTTPINGTGFQPEKNLSHLPHHLWIDHIKNDLSSR